jgi:TetR/AcrR family transcriptional repressor of nem operon
MGRPREFDEDQVLTAALETFLEHGFEATSVQDLTVRTGLQKGSLYGAFGDKRQLFLTALKRYQDRSLGEMRAALESGTSPLETLTGFFRGVVKRSCDREARGCLCVNTTVELAPHDEEVARSLARHRERVEGLFTDLVVRGQEAGEFARPLDPRAAGRYLSTLVTGLAVLARSGPGRSRLEDVVRVGLSALEP